MTQFCVDCWERGAVIDLGDLEYPAETPWKSKILVTEHEIWLAAAGTKTPSGNPFEWTEGGMAEAGWRHIGYVKDGGLELDRPTRS